MEKTTEQKGLNFVKLYDKELGESTPMMIGLPAKDKDGNHILDKEGNPAYAHLEIRDHWKKTETEDAHYIVLDLGPKEIWIGASTTQLKRPYAFFVEKKKKTVTYQVITL